VTPNKFELNINAN